MRREALRADDAQERSQGIQNDFREHSDSQQCDGGLQKPLPAPRQRQHRPGEAERQPHARARYAAGSDRWVPEAGVRPALPAAPRRRPPGQAGTSMPADCAGVRRPSAMSKNAFASRSMFDSVIIHSKLYTRINAMPDAIWIDRRRAARGAGTRIGVAGVDRRRYRIPARAHLLSQAVPAATARRRDRSGASTRCGSAASIRLMPALTAPHARKLIHAARQDLEAVYLTGQACRLAGVRHADRGRLHRHSSPRSATRNW